MINHNNDRAKLMNDDLSNINIVEGVVAGDSQAILELLQTVAPKWAEVTVDALQKDPLTGGYSGAALYKISSKTAKPPPVVVRVSGAGISTPVTKIFFNVLTLKCQRQRSKLGA